METNECCFNYCLCINRSLKDHTVGKDNFLLSVGLHFKYQDQMPNYLHFREPLDLGPQKMRMRRILLFKHPSRNLSSSRIVNFISFETSLGFTFIFLVFFFFNSLGSVFGWMGEKLTGSTWSIEGLSSVGTVFSDPHPSHAYSSAQWQQACSPSRVLPPPFHLFVPSQYKSTCIPSAFHLPEIRHFLYTYYLPYVVLAHEVIKFLYFIIDI